MINIFPNNKILSNLSLGFNPSKGEIIYFNNTSRKIFNVSIIAESSIDKAITITSDGN